MRAATEVGSAMPARGVARLRHMAAIALAPASFAPATAAPPQEAIAAGYTHLVFSDEFDRLDLSPDGGGKHRWYGGLWYQSPIDPAGRFSARGGIATMTTPAGKKSTVMSSFAPKPDGTSTLFHYGYFEARMRYSFNPAGGGTFWLESENATWYRLRKQFSPYCEIDVIEPQKGIRYGFSVHDFYALNKSNETPIGFSDHHPMTNAEEWTTYGMLWQPGRISFYRNGVQTGSVPAPAVCDQQRLFLVAGSEKHADAAEQMADFDWIHVYR